MPEDFSVVLSASTASASLGATSSPITLTVQARNGFSGTVQVTLVGIPPGVLSNLAAPAEVAAGATLPIIFGATPSANPGNYGVKALGQSGSLSHTAELSLNVAASTMLSVPRTTYIRTDAAPLLDNPPGSPRHRRLAYDAAGKRIFLANRSENRIEVFSTISRARVDTMDVPGISGVDISADGQTLWAATVTQQIVDFDLASLQVKDRRTVPVLTPLPSVSFDRPEELLTLAGGKLIVRLSQATSAQSILTLWDPASNAFTDLTSLAPSVFQRGLGVMARSGDYRRILAAANDSSGEIAEFDSTGSLLAGPVSLGDGEISLFAGNPDGSAFAVAFVVQGQPQIMLVDSALNVTAISAPMNAEELAFSADGRVLFVSQDVSAGAGVNVLDAANLQLLGRVSDPSMAGVASQIEAVDETQLLFGVANRGFTFLDAAQPLTAAVSAPSFWLPTSAWPSEGPLTGRTPVNFFVENFPAAPAVTFNSFFANHVMLAGPTSLSAASPVAFATGSVNVSAFFPDGSVAIAPDAFSYGPQILKVLPNAGSATGGDMMHIYGYGFGHSSSSVSVKLGSASARILKLEDVTAWAPEFGLDATYPFPLQRLTVQTPSATAGFAILQLGTSSGNASLPRAFQYLKSVQTFAHPGQYKFLLYDQKRQWIYLSNIDHVDVFDLRTGSFHPDGLQLQCPDSKGQIVPGPCPSAGLRGLALTPDSAQLIVADFGSQKAYLLDPDRPGKVSFVPVGGIPGFAASGPSRVAATSAQTVFVGMSGVGINSGACSSCLSQLNMTANPPIFQPAPQLEVTQVSGAPLLQGNVAGDRVAFAFAAPNAAPVAAWDAASPNDFRLSSAPQYVTDITLASDGSTYAARARGVTEIRNSDLSVTSVPAAAEIGQLPRRAVVPGIALHPTGALLYEPFVANGVGGGTSSGVDIFDAHSGELVLRVPLPEPLAAFPDDTDGLHGSFITVDEFGQRIFALTSSALTVIELANAPLGIGTVSPASIRSGESASLTVRGSGFQSGTTAVIDGHLASVTFVDANTIRLAAPQSSPGWHRLMITNPSGETTSLGAAFRAN